LIAARRKRGQQPVRNRLEDGLSALRRINILSARISRARTRWADHRLVGENTRVRWLADIAMAPSVRSWTISSLANDLSSPGWGPSLKTWLAHFGACTPDDESHSSIWLAVSICRAFLNIASRCGPGGNRQALYSNSLAACETRASKLGRLARGEEPTKRRLYQLALLCSESG
jgi:hypothetical protein